MEIAITIIACMVVALAIWVYVDSARIDRLTKYFVKSLEAQKDLAEGLLSAHKMELGSDIDDGAFRKAMEELENSIKPGDSEEDVKKKADKVLKKHGLTADIEVAKITKKKPTNKKSTNKEK